VDSANAWLVASAPARYAAGAGPATGAGCRGGDDGRDCGPAGSGAELGIVLDGPTGRHSNSLWYQFETPIPWSCGSWRWSGRFMKG
jgi:hypothetical protein